MSKPRYRITIDGGGRVWYQYSSAHTGEKHWWRPFTTEEKEDNVKRTFNTIGKNFMKFINIGEN